ncbi:MAG TPA: substrate-binding domain-containing protein [Vicinamibacterales bacterium]|nr:substrate-binding domain-containing protein [Vicinamibacterales bacterium]
MILDRRTFLEMTAAALAAPACSATRGGRPRIALVMKSLANEFFLTMERGARAHQERHADRYELIATGIKDELDVEAQVGLVEQMIARQASAIVLAPADSKALVAACARAADAGVVVVNIDNRLDAEALAERGLRVPFVGPDNRKGARLAAEEVARTLEPGAPVAILQGVPTAYNSVQRVLGFEDAIREYRLRLVASQPADWDAARGSQVAAAIIGEHPAVQALFCANDNMALGAVAAVRAAGREDEIHIVGFDNITAVRELVKAGRIAATVDQHAGDLAVFGIEYALEILETGAAPADRETPVDVITQRTLTS